MCAVEPVNSDGGRWGLRTSASPDVGPLNDECLLAAEVAASRLLSCVCPTLDSVERRRKVVEYIQRLIRNNLDCEIFPYGSVPLMTYLPEGDIDFTAFRPDESIAYDAYRLIMREEENKKAEYHIKSTQLIDAEVKLVKCIVHDFVIDISFNQLGGLSTLCFLEQVDCLIGRNHLFKRSIILVKSWSYYESRILGSQHGLLSTYALEVLVLYIFLLFNSSLHGPLEVLYRFLKYYSQFDWEKYCISLKGPVFISSLPAIVVSQEESYCNVRSEGFLDNCIEMFTTPYEGGDAKPFRVKFLNIVDPLNKNNNLGRSVHRGSFYRIRSALRYGASRLSHVLSKPGEGVDKEMLKFFKNTLLRHGKKHRVSSSFQLPEFFYQNGFPSSEANVFSQVDNGIGFDQHFARELPLRFRSLEVAEFGESELVNTSADLTGDYDTHIGSLLYGQQHYLFSQPPAPTVVHHHRQQYSSLPSPASTLFSSGATSSTIPVVSPQISNGFRMSKGLGTYFPHANSSFRMGNPTGKKYRVVAAAASPRGNIHVKDSFLPPPLQVNEKNSCRIQFGSVGTLGEEIISANRDRERTSVKGRVLQMKKNEVEFPPL